MYKEKSRKQAHVEGLESGYFQLLLLFLSVEKAKFVHDDPAR